MHQTWGTLATLKSSMIIVRLTLLYHTMVPLLVVYLQERLAIQEEMLLEMRTAASDTEAKLLVSYRYYMDSIVCPC